MYNKYYYLHNINSINLLMDYLTLNKSLMIVMAVCKSEEVGTIYQPLRSGRIWHKVNF